MVKECATCAKKMRRVNTKSAKLTVAIILFSIKVPLFATKYDQFNQNNILKQTTFVLGRHVQYKLEKDNIALIGKPIFIKIGTT